MKVAVKYCGGCNPEIDREALVRQLAENTGLDIQPAGKLPEPSVVLLVSGCARGCLNPGPDKGGPERQIVIAGESIDYWPVAKEELVHVLASMLVPGVEI